MLLFGRVVQGIGLALFISNSDAIVGAAFPESERGRAIGLENAFVGIGLSTGPPLGGFLLDTLGWQSLFYTRIPFILLFFVMGLLILRNDRGEGRHARFDFFGAILLFSFMTTFLLALNRGPRLGWSEPLIIGFVTIAFLSFIAFMYVQSRPDMAVLEIRMRGARFLRERLPVLELSLFLSRQFSASNAANALQFITQGAIIILLPFFLLDGRGLTATGGRPCPCHPAHRATCRRSVGRMDSRQGINPGHRHGGTRTDVSRLLRAQLHRRGHACGRPGDRSAGAWDRHLDL